MQWGVCPISSPQLYVPADVIGVDGGANVGDVVGVAGGVDASGGVADGDGDIGVGDVSGGVADDIGVGDGIDDSVGESPPLLHLFSAV